MLKNLQFQQQCPWHGNRAKGIVAGIGGRVTCSKDNVHEGCDHVHNLIALTILAFRLTILDRHFCFAFLAFAKFLKWCSKQLVNRGRSETNNAYFGRVFAFEQRVKSIVTSHSHGIQPQAPVGTHEIAVRCTECAKTMEAWQVEADWVRSILGSGDQGVAAAADFVASTIADKEKR